MLWIITLSLGIFALKGGLFTVITGGGFRVFGPPNTMIEDNNHFGTALTAIIPLFVYLFQTTKDHRIRMGLVGLVVLSVFAVLGTHSRGAFITLLVCGMFYLWKSGRKVLTLSAILLVAVPALLFMPTDWVGRMRTIETLGEVDTFNQREVAWQLNLRIAQDNPITGAGLRVTYGRDFVRRYFGDETMDSRAAHSIYFEILGGTGFVGLAIFVSILIGGWLSFWRVANLARGRAGLEWAEKLGVAGQIGLGTFMIGGAAVSLEMWEGYLMLIVIGTVTHSIVRRQLTKAGETLAPTWRRLSPAYPAAEAATAKAAGDRQLLPGRRSS
jgi:probable O-glycosylation ligase (exosortase A-associated)